MEHAFPIDQVEGTPDVLSLVVSTGDPGTLIGGFTSISWACMLDDLELLNHLIAAGCSATQPNIDGSTALTWVRNLELARRLVALGAKVSKEMPEGGQLSIHRCAERGQSRLLHYLATEADGNALLEKPDHLGMTPLGQAAKAGQLSCVETLLKLGADPNGADSNLGAYTPLQLALQYHHLDVVKALILHDADPSISHRMVSTRDIADKCGLARELSEIESLAAKQRELMKRRAKRKGTKRSHSNGK